MDIKKFVFGTLAGGVGYFLLGFLVYAIVFEGFFAGHTVPGIMKTNEQMKYYPLAMGNFAHGALLAYIFLKWTKIRSFGEGLAGGAAIGFFMTAGFDLIQYDTVRFMSIVGTLADIVIYTAMTALIGGIVGAVIGMGKE
jgi:uncharacterized membrane protein